MAAQRSSGAAAGRKGAPPGELDAGASFQLPRPQTPNATPRTFSDYFDLEDEAFHSSSLPCLSFDGNTSQDTSELDTSPNLGTLDSPLPPNGGEPFHLDPETFGTGQWGFDFTDYASAPAPPIKLFHHHPLANTGVNHDVATIHNFIPSPTAFPQTNQHFELNTASPATEHLETNPYLDWHLQRFPDQIPATSGYEGTSSSATLTPLDEVYLRGNKRRRIDVEALDDQQAPSDVSVLLSAFAAVQVRAGSLTEDELAALAKFREEMQTWLAQEQASRPQPCNGHSHSDHELVTRVIGKQWNGPCGAYNLKNRNGSLPLKCIYGCGTSWALTAKYEWLRHHFGGKQPQVVLFCTFDGCRRTEIRRDKLLDHMVVEHNLDRKKDGRRVYQSAKKYQVAEFCGVAKIDLPSEYTQCMFCDYSSNDWNELYGEHIYDHMFVNSLRPGTNNDDNDDGNDDNYDRDKDSAPDDGEGASDEGSPTSSSPKRPTPSRPKRGSPSSKGRKPDGRSRKVCDFKLTSCSPVADESGKQVYHKHAQHHDMSNPDSGATSRLSFQASLVSGVDSFCSAQNMTSQQQLPQDSLLLTYKDTSALHRPWKLQEQFAADYDREEVLLANDPGLSYRIKSGAIDSDRRLKETSPDKIKNFKVHAKDSCRRVDAFDKALRTYATLQAIGKISWIDRMWARQEINYRCAQLMFWACETGTATISGSPETKVHVLKSKRARLHPFVDTILLPSGVSKSIWLNAETRSKLFSSSHTERRHCHNEREAFRHRLHLVSYNATGDFTGLSKAIHQLNLLLEVLQDCQAALSALTDIASMIAISRLLIQLSDNLSSILLHLHRTMLSLSVYETLPYASRISSSLRTAHIGERSSFQAEEIAGQAFRNKSHDDTSKFSWIDSKQIKQWRSQDFDPIFMVQGMAGHGKTVLISINRVLPCYSRCYMPHLSCWIPKDRHNEFRRHHEWRGHNDFDLTRKCARKQVTNSKRSRRVSIPRSRRAQSTTTAVVPHQRLNQITRRHLPLQRWLYQDFYEDPESSQILTCSLPATADVEASTVRDFMPQRLLLMKKLFDDLDLESIYHEQSDQLWSYLNPAEKTDPELDSDAPNMTEQILSAFSSNSCARSKRC